MKQFRATVKAGGIWVQTIIFADNSMMAYKLAQAQYGSSNVMGTPVPL
jgi:hypothetical protein